MGGCTQGEVLQIKDEDVLSYRAASLNCLPSHEDQGGLHYLDGEVEEVILPTAGQYS